MTIKQGEAQPVTKEDKLKESLDRANRIIEELNWDLEYYKELAGTDKVELKSRIEDLENTLEKLHQDYDNMKKDKDFYYEQYSKEMSQRIRYQYAYEMLIQSIGEMIKGGK